MAQRKPFHPRTPMPEILQNHKDLRLCIRSAIRLADGMHDIIGDMEEENPLYQESYENCRSDLTSIEFELELLQEKAEWFEILYLKSLKNKGNTLPVS